MNIYLEIFGYIGTGLVLLSMMMTAVERLRLINAAGSVVTGLYAAISGTWPVVLLNVGMLVINTYHLVRLKKAGGRKEKAV